MGNALKVPSTVQVGASGGDGTALPPAAPVPLRKQVFHSTTLKTPEDIARQLNTMQDQIHSSTLPARSNLRNQSTTFEGLVFSGGAPVSISHKLGAKVRWSLVRWYNTAATPWVYEGSGSQADSNTLILKGDASISGTADIEVWVAG